MNNHTELSKEDYEKICEEINNEVAEARKQKLTESECQYKLYEICKKIIDSGVYDYIKKHEHDR